MFFSLCYRQLIINQMKNILKTKTNKFMNDIKAEMAYIKYREQKNKEARETELKKFGEPKPNWR